MHASGAHSARQDAHRHYGLSSLLNTPFEFNGQTFVLQVRQLRLRAHKRSPSFGSQYEVTFQSTPTCGGAYLKLLSQTETPFNGAQLVEKSPYSILFGPDKCGASGRLLFIFRHRSPITGLWREIVHEEIQAADQLFNFRTHLLTLGWLLIFYHEWAVSFDVICDENSSLPRHL